MTEAEWLTCSAPKPMLDFLKGRASDRKLLLFACACCRRIWPLLVDERSRRGVTATELYADGQMTEDDRIEALEAAHVAFVEDGVFALDAVVCLDYSASEAAIEAPENVVRAVQAEVHWDEFDEAGVLAAANERQDHAQLLRDIFRNPFRPLADLSVRLTPPITSLAQTIYDERTFEQMPQLADALEQAGCVHDDIVDHCRGPGPHVRGCWVLDLLLGKEVK